MTQASNPHVNMPIIAAGGAIINDSRRIELIGCMGAGGTATAGELYANVTKTQISSLIENDSELADAFFAVREKINEVTPIDLIPLDEPAGGTAGQKSATFSGLSTEAGSIEIGVLNNRYGYKNVAIPDASDGDAVAALVTAAFASTSKLPVTIATDVTNTDQNNFTWNHLGAQGGGFTLWVKVNVPGITVVLATVAVAAGEPTMTGLYDVNGQTRYTGIAQPGEWDETVLKEYMDSRFNVANKIQDGTAFICRNASGSGAVSDAAALNSQSLVVQYENTETKSWWIGSSMFEGNLARSAQLAALKAIRLTTGADVSEFVAGQTGIDDTIGGVELATLPYMNTPMPWPVMQTGFGYSGTEVEAIKDAGGTLAGNNDANSGVVLDEVVTTYKTNAQGDEDISFKYLNYVDTITEIRSYNMTNIKAVTRQSRATGGGLTPRRNINNSKSLSNKFVEYFGDCGDLLLSQTGEEAIEFFNKHFSLSLDVEIGLASAAMQYPIVTQLRTINAPIQIAFNL